jgi:hypothetical protein
VLSLPGDPCGEEVGWDEFEPTFVTLQYVFVYDDAPGCVNGFVGNVDEAYALVSGAQCRVA